MMKELEALLRSWVDRGVMIKDVAGLLLGTFCQVTADHYTKESLLKWVGDVLELNAPGIETVGEPDTTPKGLPS